MGAFEREKGLMVFGLVLGDMLGLSKRGDPGDVDRHIAEAAAWIARAQDATPDDGVAASYDVRRREWVSSYPETTGYIITTMYDYADYAHAPEYAERARRMAAWESEVQLEGGGVRAGKIDAPRVAPTIFNTGQVLFGWARAYQETGDDLYRRALTKAADWLVSAQDADGAWRSYPSPYASHILNTYNTRTAYGLARAFEVLQDEKYLQAAIANVTWAISRSETNTWLPDNCLDQNDTPLTHTIAYSMRGILEVGAVTQREQFIDFALRMSQHIIQAQRPDGALPGRLTRTWAPAARWTCVTGNAQMALNWLRLAPIVGDDQLKDAARKANRFNIMIHDIDNNNLSIRGGVKGSHPIHGQYMRYRYPNWAAKFFMDALMLEQGYPIDRCKGH